MDNILGNRIKDRRNILKLTQKELGSKMLVSEFNISKWERGATSPDVESLKRLSLILDCSVDYLIGKSDFVNSNPEYKKTSEEVETIAAHLEGKDITPHKMKMIKRYIDDLFDEEF